MFIYMNFLYVPKDDLNEAKKKVVKRMRKNADNEPRYAMTTDETNKYDEYVKAIVDLNDRFYTLQTELEKKAPSQATSVRGLAPSLDMLIRVTPRLQTQDLSNLQKSELEGYANEISQRKDALVEIQENKFPSGGARVHLENIINLTEAFLSSLQTILSKPVGYSGGRMPVHIM